MQGFITDRFEISQISKPIFPHLLFNNFVKISALAHGSPILWVKEKKSYQLAHFAEISKMSWKGWTKQPHSKPDLLDKTWQHDPFDGDVKDCLSWFGGNLTDFSFQKQHQVLEDGAGKKKENNRIYLCKDVAIEAWIDVYSAIIKDGLATDSLWIGSDLRKCRSIYMSVSTHSFELMYWIFTPHFALKSHPISSKWSKRIAGIDVNRTLHLQASSKFIVGTKFTVRVRWMLE